MSIDQRCYKEIVELHRFFEKWFKGDIAGDEAFCRLKNVLAPGFELVSPRAERAGRDEVLSAIHANHGALAKDVPPFRIRIKKFQSRFQQGYLCLVTYEEWQFRGGVEQGRISSALFRNNPKTPNAVEWLHLHEVGIPSKSTFHTDQP